MFPFPHPGAVPVLSRKPVAGWVIWVLTAVLTMALVANNAEYLFHHPAYEDGDAAANSLQVRQAKRFREIHGAYSRWGFHHPGPMYFYVLGLGEGLLYDVAKVVPTPFNAQLIATMALSSFFLSAGLVLFTRRLPRAWQRFFLPLAIGITAWHFTIGGTPPAAGSAVFLSIWTAHAAVLPFFCLVVACASVASGAGEDLGYLVLAGGILVHLHVAQPLFVVPLSLLAYAGLLHACRVREREERWGLSVGPLVTGPWRRFPRAHEVAGWLLGLFLLPLVIDALQGSDSNFARILAHVREHPAGHHSLARAVCYFFQFGAYDSYDPGRLDFGRYDAAGMGEFVVRHWLPYAFWATVPLAFGVLAVVARPMPRFLAWFAASLGATAGLTLVWGMRQEGEMFYYNALFNSAIYGTAALLPAVAVAALLARILPSRRSASMVPVGVSGLLFLLAGGILWSRASRAHTGGYDDAPHRAVAEAVRRGELTLTLAPAGRKEVPFILFPPNALDLALAVAVQLDRAGFDFCVDNDWGNLFGEAHTPAHRPPADPLPTTNWRIVPPAGARATRVSALPTGYPDHRIVTSTPTLDPAAGERIVFSRDGNYELFSLSGWAPTDTNWTWSSGRDVGLGFHPEPASAAVEMSLRAWPFTVANKLKGQRVEVFFNDVTVGLSTLRDEAHPVVCRIPTALWNSSAGARVRLHFPDAASPRALGLGGQDVRLLGGGFRSIDFRLITTP